MPFAIRKIRGKNLYSVKNTQTGTVHSYGTTHNKAKKQVRLLHSLEGRGLNTNDIQSFIQNGYHDRELDKIGDFELDKQLSTRKAQVYHNPLTNEVVVNNRGTKKTSLADWSNNLQYLMGNYEDTDRMKQAEKVQKQAIDKYGKVDVNVGHSQGGIITRNLNEKGLTKEVINVNPATMFEKQKKNETVIRSSGDVVSVLQSLNPFNKKKKTHIVKAVSSNPITEHGESILARMGNVFVGKGLNEMKDNQLNNYELDDLVKHYKIKDYHGTYIKDQLPELNHGFYIINLNGQSHWTVLYKYVDPNGDTQYLYFDSFGFPAPTEVEQSIYKDARRKVDVIYSPIQLQDIDHTSCGFFVVAWMRFLNRKSTDKVKLYRQFLKKFKEPTENDIVVKRLMEGGGLDDLPSEILSSISEYNDSNPMRQHYRAKHFAEQQRKPKLYIVGGDEYTKQELQTYIRQPIDQRFETMYINTDVDHAIVTERQLFKALKEPLPPHHLERLADYFQERDLARGILRL